MLLVTFSYFLQQTMQYDTDKIFACQGKNLSADKIFVYLHTVADFITHQEKFLVENE